MVVNITVISTNVRLSDGVYIYHIVPRPTNHIAPRQIEWLNGCFGPMDGGHKVRYVSEGHVWQIYQMKVYSRSQVVEFDPIRAPERLSRILYYSTKGHQVFSSTILVVNVLICQHIASFLYFSTIHFIRFGKLSISVNYFDGKSHACSIGLQSLCGFSHLKC